MNNNISPNSGIQKKKKRKFNIVDFLIIVLIVAVILVVVNVFSPFTYIKNLTSTETVSLQYAVKLTEVDEEYIHMIAEGDNVINSVTKNTLGTVKSIAVEGSTTLGYDKDDNTGEITGKLIPIAEKYDITVWLSAEALYEKGVGYTVEGARIAVGEALSLNFSDFVWSGYCTEASFPAS